MIFPLCDCFLNHVCLAQAPFLWSPYILGGPLYFCRGFFLSFFFFSSPNVSGRRLDIYHTSSHGVALV